MNTVTKPRTGVGGVTGKPLATLVRPSLRRVPRRRPGRGGVLRSTRARGGATVVRGLARLHRPGSARPAPLPSRFSVPWANVGGSGRRASFRAGRRPRSSRDAGPYRPRSSPPTNRPSASTWRRTINPRSHARKLVHRQPSKGGEVVENESFLGRSRLHNPHPCRARGPDHAGRWQQRIKAKLVASKAANGPTPAESRRRPRRALRPVVPRRGSSATPAA